VAIQLRRGIEAKMISVRFPVEVAEWLRMEAEREHRHVSNHIVHLLMQEMQSSMNSERDALSSGANRKVA